MLLDILDGCEVHAVVFLDTNEMNPLERIQTKVFSNKLDFESATIFLKKQSSVKILKTEVHIKVPGLNRSDSNLYSLITSNDNNPGPINLQLFSSKSRFDMALELTDEIIGLNIHSIDDNNQIMNYSKFMNSYPVHI